MRVKKKHTFAIIFMAVAIAGSIPLGINRTLYRLQEDAAGDYYVDQAGYSIWEGIDNRQAAANDLITLAERYTDKNPALASLADDLDYRVRTSENAWSDDNTFRLEAEANFALDASAQALADELARTELSEKDKKYPAQIMDRLKGEQDKISRSSYNDSARAFNEKLASLSPMALVKPMATFDVPAGLVEKAEVTETRDTGVSAALDSVQEQAADRVGETADRMDDYASRVDTYAGEIANRADDYADEIVDRTMDSVDGFVDSIWDSVDRILG